MASSSRAIEGLHDPVMGLAVVGGSASDPEVMWEEHGLGGLATISNCTATRSSILISAPPRIARTLQCGSPAMMSESA